ncbi:MAG: Gfo/Idh/MocA family oxidoreductase [Treponema sp.]|nr:Gfo/Idh/MocA family oxidoreductase [Treponema sp.]
MKIKAAIIGLGRIASILEDDSLREKPCTHAGAIVSNEDCVLAAGCDKDEERRIAFSRKWSVPSFSDAEKMLSEYKPQILAIATHPDSHYHYCNLAAKHKVPVIICEKPLADSLTDARKIVDLTNKKDGPVIITNHERRYSKDFERAKTILKEGILGDIISIRAVLYFGQKRKLINMLWDDGTHLIDAIMFLTGFTMTHKSNWGADFEQNKGTAWIEGELSSSSPIPVIIEVGAGRDHLVFEIEFSCENGRLRIGNGVFEVYRSVSSSYAQNFNSLENTGETFSGPTGYFANMLKDAVNCVKDPQRIPVSGALDGLHVIEYLNNVKAWRK